MSGYYDPLESYTSSKSDNEMGVDSGKHVVATDTLKDTNVTLQESLPKRLCEMCGDGASETYTVDMFCILQKTYVPPFAKNLRYKKSKVRIPCCRSCLSKIEHGNSIVSIAIWLSVISISIWFAITVGCTSVWQYIGVLIVSVCLSAMLGFPIFWIISRLCGEGKLCARSATIRKLKDQGWKLGTKPSKCDM